MSDTLRSDVADFNSLQQLYNQLEFELNQARKQLVIRARLIDQLTERNLHLREGIEKLALHWEQQGIAWVARELRGVLENPANYPAILAGKDQ